MGVSSKYSTACGAFATLLLASAGGLASAEDGEDLAAELPRIPPTEAARALETFRVRDGFRLELVASEPDVVDPIAMAFDAGGRMFVVEMRDYPFTSDADNLTASDLAKRQPKGRIRRLEDTDGDGRADRSTVFLDGLHWPTAVACWKDGVFVAAAPDIIRARDADGDGVAESSEVHYSGFGRHNVQALLNGLEWGIDHHIYGNASFNGGEVRSLAFPDLAPVQVRGRDFRFSPGRPLEAIPSGGGQFGLSIDDWGNRFTASNSSHARHAISSDDYSARNPYLAATATSTEIAVDGGAATVFRASPPEPWRVVRTRWRAASSTASRYAPTELVPVGFFTSATGILVYGGDAYGEEYRGDLFVGDVGGNLVHRKVLEPRGVTFAARRPDADERDEFIVSTDNWFRPAQLVEGPDGAIYILDMYRETIEHPHSIPPEIKAHLDLLSGNDRGRIYRLVRADRELPRRDPPGRLSSSGLVRALESRSAWTRRNAARLLVERRDVTVVEDLRRIALSAELPQARLEAVYTLEALGLLEDDDLARALNDPHSALRRHAVRLSERRLARSPALLEGVVSCALDAAAGVRLQVAYSLGEFPSEAATRGLLEVARRDAGDPWIEDAVLGSSLDRGGALLAALAADREFVARPEAARFLRRLAELAGARGEEDGLARIFEALRDGGALDDRLRAHVLEGAGDGLRRKGLSLGSLLEAPPQELAANARSLAEILERARAAAVDRERSDEERLAAARLLAFAPPAKALPALSGLLDPQEPPALQLRAVEALSSLDDRRVAGTLVGAWHRASPLVRREMVEALFRRPPRLLALIDALEEGVVPAADLDPARRRELLDHRDATVRGRAREVLEDANAPRREDVIAEYRAALVLAGDRTRGGEVFRRACATCHRAGGQGHAVGPDLETVRNRTGEDLLLHILAPNREVSPQFIAYSAVLRDGRVITGAIAEETATSLRFVRAEGATDTVLRVEVAHLESSGISLMPEGLEKDLTPQELADLIECIRSLGTQGGG